MEQVPQTEKHETFKTKILRILKGEGKPINREQLVKKAIKENPPESQRPEWVYHDVIRRLSKDGLIAISAGRLKKDQTIALV